jgi:hypothetical protein
VKFLGFTQKNKEEKERKMFMKKLICVLTLLFVASTAMAGVTISCTESGGTVTVSYVATEDANKPRAMGLDISVDGDGVISNVTPLSTGIDGYWVFPGTYGIDINATTGEIDGTGTPVADPCQHPDTLSASNAITVEMGSLHYPAAVNSVNAPGLSGDLLSFDVTGTGTVNVTIAGNAIRGNVVNYDAGAADAVYTGCQISFAECMKDTHPSYTNWGLFNKPDCWCYKYQCRGDADGLAEGPFWVSLNYLNILRTWIDYFDPVDPNPLGSACANFDHDKEGPFWVSLNDLIILRQWIDYFDPANPIPECNDVHINEWLTP